MKETSQRKWYLKGAGRKTGMKEKDILANKTEASKLYLQSAKVWEQLNKSDSGSEYSFYRLSEDFQVISAHILYTKRLTRDLISIRSIYGIHMEFYSNSFGIKFGVQHQWTIPRERYVRRTGNST